MGKQNKKNIWIDGRFGLQKTTKLMGSEFISESGFMMHVCLSQWETQRWRNRFNKKQVAPVTSEWSRRVIYTNVTYFLVSQEHLIFQFIHIQRLHMLIVHLPKHWFHMVLETGYKHLCHQMKSVSECSPQLNKSSDLIDSMLSLKHALQDMLDMEKKILVMLCNTERWASCC